MNEHLVPAEHGIIIREEMSTPRLMTIAEVVNESEPDSAWGTRNEAWEGEVLWLVNEHRESKGLKPLEYDYAVGNCAGWKALHMAGYRYMNHNDPAPPIERSIASRFNTFGIIGSWGENIAYGYSSPKDVMQGWIISEGHHRNIIHEVYRYLGVGAANNSGTWYWCQCFSSERGVNPPLDLDPTPIQDLHFNDRHALGVFWDTRVFSENVLSLSVWSGTQWTKVREVPNKGNTYVTFPFTYTGQTKVRLQGGSVILEGTAQIRPVRFA